MSVITQAISRRGAGRIWQGDRRNGANTLTISAGHAIDALCFVVGEFEDVSARLATTITEWHNTDTNTPMTVDSPDWIAVNGRLVGGAQASFVAATVPANPSGTRFEVYGRDGTLTIGGGGSFNLGPNRLSMARGSDPLAEVEIPERFMLTPASTPAGSPRNVAQAYARWSNAAGAGEPFTPDFAHAVTRHRLIDAIEWSAAEGRAVRL
jgi:predicted dehydrogenase